MEDQQTQKPFFVVVNGVQVFTADFVHEQMAAQSRSISRARTIATVSTVLAVIAMITCIASLCS